MAKKKKPIDDKQKSLFAYVDEKKEEKTKKVVKSKKKPAEDEAKKDIEKPSPEKTAEEKKSKQPEEEFIQEVDEKDAGVKEEMEHIPAEIPPEMFFKGNEEPFGLKKDAVELKDVKRESVSSKYVRYLIKNEKIVENMDRGLLLDVDYDGGENKAYCKFYDLDDDEIKIWIDTTGHEPYCLSKESKSDLENISDLVNYEGFKRFEEVEIKELLSDQDLTMTKIYGNTPLDIGGSGKNIKNILGDSGLKAWEADIRYHLNYIFDTQLISGLIYSIKNGKTYWRKYCDTHRRKHKRIHRKQRRSGIWESSNRKCEL